MPSPQRDERREAIQDRFEEVLDNYNLGARNCGKKTRDARLLPRYDLTSGFWNGGYGSKATRWLFHLVQNSDGTLCAELPNRSSGDRLGFFNVSNTSIGIAGVTIRIVPLAKVTDNQYLMCDDWQWLLWFIFKPPLKLAKNTSSYSLHDYDPTTGKLKFQNADQPYAAAGLMALCDPGATLPSNPILPAAIANATYQQATEVLATLLQVNPTAPVRAQEDDQ